MSEITTESFTFTRDGDRLVGTLHRPKGVPAGVVVTTGPLSSVKEQATGAYARAMAERGYAALAFDHRGFGESGGEPRQLENPLAKAADISAAVDALQTDEQFAALAVTAIGVCAGGGYMARAVADDPRIRAIAAVAGYFAASTDYDGQSAQGRAAIDRGRAAERRWRETGETEMIPAVAPDGGDVAMPLPEAYEYYGTPRGAVANYVNAFAVQSFVHTTPFDAQEAASRLIVPFLLVHSERALAPPLARRFYDAVATEKAELWLESAGQVDFYDDPALIGPAADAASEFFREVS